MTLEILNFGNFNNAISDLLKLEMYHMPIQRPFQRMLQSVFKDVRCKHLTLQNFRFSFVEYLVNGCRYFHNILYLDTY